MRGKIHGFGKKLVWLRYVNPSGPTPNAELIKDSMVVLNKLGGPHYRHQNTIILILGTPKKILLISGRAHIEAAIEIHSFIPYHHAERVSPLRICSVSATQDIHP